MPCTTRLYIYLQFHNPVNRLGSHRVLSFSILYVFILDLNSSGPDDGPIRTETCSPTINKVYIGHLLVVLDDCINNILIH